ncbi:hypothetical protein NP493_748g00021 [Ridgeia piscesae]|uniref:BMP and activin membrane-bound inhibitor homolog n=1 Tax=Ridgeia piscesae TaxID=27915 RepID=A0AAD9KR46_RIDPI|nr:hypothetical protein NP493_748g00021 [Ridgeia piscesae]
MCKSPTGRCFSHLTYEGDASRSTHGCAESLAGEDRDACDAPGDVIHTKGAASIWPILKCCQRDMCNYMDDVDVQVYVGTQNNASAPVRGHNPRHSVLPPDNDDYRYADYISQRDLWFKAAVIAVPIAGGFILILLVLLAVRMLRHDSRRHRRLMQLNRHSRSLTKAQLYVADHFYNSGGGGENKDADLNYNSRAQHTSIYVDPTLNADMAPAPNGYARVSSNSETAEQYGVAKTVIRWGETGSPGTATVV